MPKPLGTFSVAENYLLVDGFRITGFASGTMMTFVFDDPLFNDETGADGEVTRVRTEKLKATATVRLQQSSASNDVLSALLLADSIENFPFDLAVKDNSGRTIGNGTDSWIVKYADLEFGDTPAVREWTIRIPKFVLFIGGNN